MTQVLIDPTDPTKAFIGSSTDPVLGAAVGEATLTNIHPANRCAGRACIIHNPTEHHMSGWVLHWRDDKGMFERICPHGTGHPDPDQFAFWDTIPELSGMGVHGCDGCCAPPEPPRGQTITTSS